MNTKTCRVLSALISTALLGGVLSACGGDGGSAGTSGTSSAETSSASSASGDAGSSSGSASGALCEADQKYADWGSGSIKEADMALFPAKDLKGETIRLLNLGVDPKGEAIADDEMRKADAQANLERIEAKYNCKIEFVTLSSTFEEIPNEVIKSIASGQPVADVLGGYYQWLPQLVAGEALMDMSSVITSDKYVEKYIDMGTWSNTVWSLGSGVGGEGLIYNRKMIKDAGMEKTPTEMFMEGKWSYDDFFDYCVELKSKLKADEYPFYIDPYYWIIFATAANGTSVVNNDGTLNYTTDGFVEAVEFLQKLKDNNLIRPSNADENGAPSYWSTPAETFDTGKEVAMTHRAAWQADGLVGKVDFGWVGYPWGSQIQVTGDYTTLPDNYHSAFFDGMNYYFLKGTEKGRNMEDVLSMLMDYDNHAFMLKARPEEKAKAPTWLDDEDDVTVYQFVNAREALDPVSALSNLGKITIGKTVRSIYNDNLAIRSTLESVYPQDQASLKSAGFSK